MLKLSSGISTRFVYPVSMVVILAVIFMLGIIGIDVRHMASADSEIISTETSAHYAGEIRLTLSSALRETFTLAGVFETIKKHYVNVSRYETNRILKEFIETHPEFISVYAAFEPDGFYQDDSLFIFQPGHDEMGRFMPFWTRDESGRGFLESLNSTEIYENSTFYQKAKESKHLILAEPYVQRIQGHDILVTSAIAPILDRTGDFMGIIGVDMGLEDLQKTVAAVHLYDSGYLCVYSNQGTIISSPDKEEIGSNIRDTYGDARLINRLIKGDPFRLSHLSHYLDKPVLAQALPVEIPNCQSKWMVVAYLPKHEIFKRLYSLNGRILLLGFLAVILVTGLIVKISGTVTRPVIQLMNRMQELSQGEGDLTQRIRIESRDEIGKLAASFNVFMDKIHEIMGQVKTSTDTVTEAAKGIRSTTHHMNEGARRQHTITDEVVANIHEMTAAITQNSSIAHQTAETTKLSGLEARNGVMILKRNMDGMHRIEKASASTLQMIQALKTHSEQIEEIIDAIRDIAGCTNVLSLNATIQAVKAGEHGAGFQVVAREIRDLARQTTAATEKIIKSIDTVQKDAVIADKAMGQVIHTVQDGKKAANDTENALLKIFESVEEIHQMIQEVDKASSEQSSIAQVISARIESISSVANENSVSLNQMSAAVDKMNIQTNDLRKVVYRFKLKTDVRLGSFSAVEKETVPDTESERFNLEQIAN